jgi:flagellar hook-associated protein 3 FlgL
MRVSERMFKNLALDGVQAAERESIEIQNKIASGKEVLRPSDDPLKFITSHRFKAVVKSREQHLRNISDARRFLDDNEAAVGRVTDLLQQVRQLMVRSGNETNTTADLRLSAMELRGHLDALVQFANAEGVGGKIFGGAETETDPFEIVRDTGGNITDVIYHGDAVAARREIAEGSTVDVNLVGSKLFQVDPDTIESSFTATYAGQDLATAGIPAGDTTGYFSLQGRPVYFDTTQDSLIDIAKRIDENVPEINARVTGSLVGTATFPSTGGALGATAGTLRINGVDITIPAGSSLDGLASAINAVTDETGVTASAATVTGGFALQLDGGVEIDDTRIGSSNVMQVLGITSSGSPPDNLFSRNALDYRLEIAAVEPDQLFANDVGSGRFLERLGITDGTSNSPANSGNGTVTDLSLFNVLIGAIDDMENGRFAEIRDTHLGDLDRGLERILKFSGEIGASTKRLDTDESRAQDFIIQAKSVISANEDLDFAQAISDLRRAQLKLETAIGAAQNVPAQNLLRFL